jgi:hypothetical protein
MGLPKVPEFRALSCWPSVAAVAVCAAWRLEPPRVLLIQVDHKMRRLEHFTMRFQDALRTAR